MKYIRTKDGIFDETQHRHTIQKGRVSIIGVLYDFKQADTIEELCDEFVIKDNDCGLCYLLNDESKYSIQEHIKDQIDILVNDFKMQNETCYGAIWTDKGLIYVAKLNEEGEFELL